jgi:hypothetical protein
LGQPRLDGAQETYIVSGSGDGGLVDLCRLTIERFRQDTVLYEIFQDGLEAAEAKLRPILDPHQNLWSQFRQHDSLLAPAKDRLRARLRKDAKVILEAAGAGASKSSLIDLFGPGRSVLNRLMTYMLHEIDAFELSVSGLASCVALHGVPPQNVICRHGTDRRGELERLIRDWPDHVARVHEIEELQAQHPVPTWEPGTFPVPK